MRGYLLPPALAIAVMLVRPPTSPPDELPTISQESPAFPSAAPLFSFNGRDLAGFYTFTRYHKYQDPGQVFSVREGMIRVSGQETGGFVTRDSFSNYHLVAEWKWGHKTWYPRKFQARNSGILVHCQGLDGDGLASWMESIECQIIEGGSGDLLIVPGKGPPPSLSAEVRIGPDGQPYYQPGGERKTLHQFGFHWWGRDPSWNDVLWFRGPDDRDKPVGEWNRMEVICDGDTITCLLNGTLVNRGIKSSLTSGKILFQSEGAEIYFRKIEIRPLVK